MGSPGREGTGTQDASRHKASSLPPLLDGYLIGVAA